MSGVPDILYQSYIGYLLIMTINQSLNVSSSILKHGGKWFPSDPSVVVGGCHCSRQRNRLTEFKGRLEIVQTSMEVCEEV